MRAKKDADRVVKKKGDDAVAVLPSADARSEKTWFVVLLMAIVIVTGFIAWSRVQARLVQFEIAEAKQVKEEEIQIEADRIGKQVTSLKRSELVQEKARQLGMVRPPAQMTKTIE